MGIYSSAFDEGVNMANKFAPTPTPTPQPKAPTPVAKPVAQPRKYLGGNIVDKAFDVLRTPEYAQAGFVQGGMDYAKSKGLQKKAPITSPIEFGKSIVAGVKNIPKAISERREYGREEGQYNIGEEAGFKDKYGQTAVNLGLSLAAPSLALGSVAKGISKIPGVSKVTSKVGGLVQKGVELARKTEPIARVVEKVNPYFRNQALGKLVKEAEERVANRQTQVVNTVMKSAKGLKPEEQRLVGQILEGKVVNDPTGRLTSLAAPIREMSDSIGKEAVDLGLLDAKSYETFKGKYMTHIWEQMKKGGDNVNFAKSDFPKGTSKFLTKERKGAEGYISEFTPAVLKGLGTEVKDIEVAKMYKEIADTFGQKAGSYLEKGKAYAPSSVVGSKAGKVLRNTELPQDVVDIMTKTMTPKKRGIFDKAYDLWKKGKTIYNPAYHVRNLATNQILSDMSTGEGLGKTAVNYVKSVRSYKGKGGQEFVEAANKVGLIGRQNLGGAFDEAMDLAGLGKGKNILQKGDKALAGFQNASEETAKLNVFTTWVKKAAKEAGKSVQEALGDDSIVKMAKDKAEEAIFSPYRIGKQERSVASKIVPFYSFTRQMLPFLSKTAVNKPGTLTKYEKGKTAVEGLSPERKGEFKPEYAKGQIRLPVKDKEGRSYYMNPKYILPYGNLGEDVGPGKLPLGMSLAPYLTMPAELASNKQFYYDKPIVDSKSPRKKREQLVDYLGRSLLPTVIGAGGKLKDAVQGKTDSVGRQRNVPAAVADALGFKTSSFVPEQQQQYEGVGKSIELKEIQKEKNKILRDKSISPENKKRYIEELDKARLELLK